MSEVIGRRNIYVPRLFSFPMTSNLWLLTSHTKIAPIRTKYEKRGHSLSGGVAFSDVNRSWARGWLRRSLQPLDLIPYLSCPLVVFLLDCIIELCLKYFTKCLRTFRLIWSRLGGILETFFLFI